jgi:hypothetical protein
MSLNDLPDPSAAPEAGTQDSAAALLQYFRSQDQRSYSVQQFVEPEEAGGGIPLSFTGTTTPPIGGGQTYVPPR